MLAQNKATIISWLICGLGALYYAYEYLLRITPSVMEHALRGHFDLSATGFGVLSACYSYAYVPMQLPVGLLMDRYGPRRLLFLACAICVVGTWMFANTTLLSVAGIGRFLVGFGSAFAFVGVLKLATLWLPEDKLGVVAGIASGLGTLGAIIGDNTLGRMVEHWGWQDTVNGTAWFGIILLVVMWFGIHDKKRHLAENGGTIDTFRRAFLDLRVIAGNSQIWINGLFGCLVYLPTTVFAELWGIPYLRYAHHLTPQQAEIANSLLFFGFMLGAPLMGYVSDHLRRRKLPMFIGAMCAAVVMMAILYFPGLSIIQLNCLMFILGVSYSVQALVFAVGRELSPNEAAGTAIAMTNMLVMIGAIFVQPLVGHLLDWSHEHQQLIHNINPALITPGAWELYSSLDYQLALSVLPIGILIAAFLSLFLKETYAHST
jgi:MFS family permease